MPRSFALLLFLAACGQEDTLLIDADNDGVVAGVDCDDTDSAVFPGAVEVCDGVDSDCDGVVDNAPEDGATWFTDGDGDGFGAALSPVVACEQPEGTVQSSGDCDDTDATRSPGAAEVCDGVDNDCNGLIDDGSEDQSEWFADLDGDGYGHATESVMACEKPAHYVADSSDCDDTDVRFHPSASEESCSDPLDYNCDGSVGYSDADGDGYAACSDCDDTNTSVHPDAVERCNGLDDNCNSLVDERGAQGEQLWYRDADSDGYGYVAATKKACEAPVGYVENAGDCNDSSELAYPGGVERCDGVDNDCNGQRDDNAIDALDWYSDGDGDGFGRATLSTRACAQPENYVSDATDCDDNASSINPSGTEVCNGLDDNCDQHVDEGFDSDADGWTRCGGDCDDQNGAIFPHTDEVCDQLDNDCDGSIDESAVDASRWFLDYDGDGYGEARFTLVSCDSPTGYVNTADDCDDLDLNRHPNAPLSCDGSDADCDGFIDNDADLDGYSDLACGGGDCDDTDPLIIPQSNGLCALGQSCADLLAKGLSTGSGVYTIDVDGQSTGLDPVEVYCEMDLDGGGWTLLGKFNLNVTGPVFNGVPWRVDSAVNLDFLLAPDDDTLFGVGHLSRDQVVGVINYGVVNAGGGRIMNQIKQHSTQNDKRCENLYASGVDTNWSFLPGARASPGVGSCGAFGWGYGNSCGVTSTTCASYDANYTMDGHWMHANGLNVGSISGVVQTYCGDNSTSGIGRSTAATGARRGTCYLWGQ